MNFLDFTPPFVGPYSIVVVVQTYLGLKKDKKFK